VGGRVDPCLLHLGQDLAGQGVVAHDPLDLLAPELHADGCLVVRREHLERVAPDAESPPDEVRLVPPVLDVHQPLHGEVAVQGDALDDAEHLAHVLLGRAQPVDAGHAGHDDHVAPRQERGGGRVAERSISSLIDESFSM
jgi:hypothetical protein